MARIYLVIAALQKEWNRYNAKFPFYYNFLDDKFKTLYEDEQRTGLLFSVFAIAGFAAIIIALITISFQSIKAALANPVKSLRTE